ncbi:predicted protein [Postia placenta Mad-698-R]|nr:predicted protein [Postia placenta Mad-698-R]
MCGARETPKSRAFSALGGDQDFVSYSIREFHYGRFSASNGNIFIMASAGKGRRVRERRYFSLRVFSSSCPGISAHQTIAMADGRMDFGGRQKVADVLPNMSIAPRTAYGNPAEDASVEHDRCRGEQITLISG